MPLYPFEGQPNAADELVVFQEAQTCPLFLVTLKEDAAFERKGEVPPAPGYHYFVEGKLETTPTIAAPGSSFSFGFPLTF